MNSTTNVQQFSHLQEPSGDFLVRDQRTSIVCRQKTEQNVKRTSLLSLSTVPTINPVNTTKYCFGDDEQPYSDQQDTPEHGPLQQPVPLMPSLLKIKTTPAPSPILQEEPERPFVYGEVSNKAYRDHLGAIEKEMLLLESLNIRSEPFSTNHMVNFDPKPFKKLLLLDLDETLVHSYRAWVKGGIPVLIPYQGQEYTYWLTIRPHVKEFLQQLCKHWTLIIFTASTEDYAECVQRLIDPERNLISGILTRNNCIYEKGALIKDLRIFRHIHLKDIVIIDNSVRSFWFHKNNGILILTWIDDPNDTELISMVEYLIQLSTVPDVRQHLKRRFDLENFLLNVQ